jgi:hypothetical protein
MWRILWQHLIGRYHWLNPKHVVAQRELAFGLPALPPFVGRIGSGWTFLSYAAALHALFFVLGVVMYLNQSHVSRFLLDLIAPFVTPFGTPISVAMLATLLHWMMIIGVCTQVQRSFGQELSSGSWQILRQTPYPTSELMLAKLRVIASQWFDAIRTLTLVRLIALLVLPLVVAAQITREQSTISTADALSAAIFLIQPFSDLILAISFSLLATTFVPHPLWGRAAALGLTGLVLAGNHLIFGGWLSFTSPVGGVAAALTPLGQWLPLVTALFPPTDAAMFQSQLAVMVLVYAVLPLALSWLGLRWAYRRLLA